MKILRCSLVGLFTLIVATAQAVERLPVEDFARAPDVTRARLSPDGKHLAYLAEVNGRTKLHVAEPGTNVVVRLDIGGAPLMNNAPKEVASFGWVSNDRLIITTAAWDTIYGVMAVNRDGGHEVAISGYEGLNASMGYSESFLGMRLFAYEVIHSFYDKDETVLMLDRHQQGGGKGPNRPDVIAVNTDNGQSRTVVENPGEVSIWGVDNYGVARLGILSHGDLKGAIYRENESTPWRTILPLQDRKGKMRPVSFDGAKNKVYVTDLTEQKRWTVFPLDPATGEKGAPLIADPEYDILPDHFIPSMDGLLLATTLVSSKKDALIGIRFVTDAPRVKWFDRDYAVYQQAVDKALPNTVNLLVDSSEDEKRLLWFGFSDQSPGTYYLMDLEKHSFKPVAPRMSWIKPAQMAPMLAVNYKARDGLLVHGFLTVPVGHKPQGLPLVVMPHGGPWVRDVWGFDPLVQLLANRDYAVLQMNYRGSPGYGEQLYEEARRQIGGKIQDDIEDATRWAIAAGVAEPKRIAIFGGSYGGYSALFALGHNPELYRCGISYAGVTDWPAIFTDSDMAESKAAKKYWREQIGDLALDKDKDMLRSVSPVNFADKIAAPVLIIQGKDDRRVPQDQARRMIAALEKAGRKPESRFIAGIGHTYGREKDRIETFKTVVDFLQKQLGPGVE